ncbi:MAG: T9SS type A sorting domain-containing protein, partial [Flavobacteriales bacterium]|nr:T9SS type A sorting domain-containing protein [Flavobacteriales bacterium]
VSSSGLYKTTVRNSYGCEATSNAIQVTAYPATPVPSLLLTGDSVLCAGDSATLSTNLSSGLLWSNGATSVSTKIGSSGSYRVMYTEANGCTSYSKYQSIVVNSVPATPVITANGPLVFCDGGSVLLSSSVGANNKWSNNDTNVSISVTTSGSYAVTVKNTFGCAKTSTPVTVIKNSKPTKPSLLVTGDTVLCQGDSVILSTANGSGLLWSNGPTTASQVVKTSGFFSVTKTDGNNCSSTSRQVQIKVNPKPSIPAITASGATTFCQGNNVLLTSSSSVGNIWSTADTSASVLVASSGNYSVKVRNQFGCETSSANQVVTVNPIPTKPQLTLVGDSVFCSGDSAQLSTNYSTGLSWSHGGSASNVTVRNTGFYSVTYTNGNGCASTSRVQGIVANPNPSIPTITNTGALTFCQGGSVLLTSSSATNNKWSSNDTSNSILVSTSGNYSVNVRNQFGCEASSANVFVKANQNPAKPTLLVTGDTTFCQGDSAIIQSSYTTGIVWSNSSTTPLVVAKNSGFYSVTYTDTNNCSATSKSLRITSNPIPSLPTVTASGPLTFCDGNSVTLNSSASSGNKWSRGDSSASILVTTSGNYAVTAYNQYGCTATSANILVQVNPLPSKPTITANGPLAFCQGDSVILGSSSLSGNQWSTTDTTRTIYVKSTGIYSLRIVNQNGCQSPLENVSITVNPIPSAPVVTANGPIGFCLGDSVRLTSNSVNGNIWNNADTNQSTIIKSSGSYFVKLVNQHGCEALSNSITVSVGSLPNQPSISLIGSSTFCQGDSVTLVSTASLGNRWSTNDTSQSIIVKNPGKYTLRRFQNGCFSKDTSQFVTVNPNPIKPTISYTGSTTFCQGDSVQLFSSSSTGNRWNSNDTASTILVKTTGQFSVEVRNAFGCKTTSDALLVNAKAIPSTPSISLIGKSKMCLGDSVTLVSNGSNGNRWSTGDSSNSIVVKTPGTISLRTLMNGCYSGAASQPIVVNSKPSAPLVSFTGDTTFCPGDSVMLHSSYTSGNSWTGGFTANSISVKQTGLFQVTYTDTNGCFAISKAISTRKFAAPQAPYVSPSGTVDLCEGDFVVLKSDVTNGIEWNSNQSRMDTLTVNSAGNYFVTHTDGNGCSIVSNSVSVSILPAPSKPVVTQNALDLESSAAASYQWSFGGTPLAGAIGKTHRPQNNGVYQVSIADGNGCRATSAPFTFNAVGIEMADLVESFKLYPNPSNGSFTMDLQMAQLKNLEVVIYSSQGQEVHRESIKPTELFVKREYELQYLPSGIYHFELISDVGKYSGRLNINR